MAENKTCATEADVDTFLETVENKRRRADADILIEMMRDITGVAPKMWGPSIIGFGSYSYSYESGREGDMFMAGFSPRKANLAIYVVPSLDPFAAQLETLGKHKKGASCLYINKLDDIDLDCLRDIVSASFTALADRKTG